MASIISTKRTNNGVILELKTSYDEYLDLQGHMDTIHIFAEKEDSVETHISQRGKNGATKYFLIPREMRKGFKFNNAINCQRIIRDDKILFIYVVDKLRHVSRKKTAFTKEQIGMIET